MVSAESPRSNKCSQRRRRGSPSARALSVATPPELVRAIFRLQMFPCAVTVPDQIGLQYVRPDTPTEHPDTLGLSRELIPKSSTPDFGLSGGFLGRGRYESVKRVSERRWPGRFWRGKLWETQRQRISRAQCGGTRGPPRRLAYTSRTLPRTQNAGTYLGIVHSQHHERKCENKGGGRARCGCILEGAWAAAAAAAAACAFDDHTGRQQQQHSRALRHCASA